MFLEHQLSLCNLMRVEDPFSQIQSHFTFAVILLAMKVSLKHTRNTGTILYMKILSLCYKQ